MYQEALRIEHVTITKNNYFILKDFSLTLETGESLCLLGITNTGKSALVHLLSGTIIPDTGTIYLESLKVPVIDPKTSGIYILSNNELIPDMSIAENFYIALPSKTPFYQKKKSIKKTQELLQLFQIGLPPEKKIRELTIPERNILSILRAYCSGKKIIVIDNVLDRYAVPDFERLKNMLTILKSMGLSFILTTRNEEACQLLGDRGALLCNGFIYKYFNPRTFHASESINRLLGNAPFGKQTIAHKPNSDQYYTLSIPDQNTPGKSLTLSAPQGSITGCVDFNSQIHLLFQDLLNAPFSFKEPMRLDTYGKSVRFHSINQAFQNNIGFAFDTIDHKQLFSCFSIEENVTLQFLARTRGRIVRRFSNAQNQVLFSDVFSNYLKDTPGFLHSRHYTLMRSLLARQEVLICLMSFAQTDDATKANIFYILDEIARSGTTIFLFSKDFSIISPCCDQINVIDDFIVKRSWDSRDKYDLTSDVHKFINDIGH